MLASGTHMHGWMDGFSLWFIAIQACLGTLLAIHGCGHGCIYSSGCKQHVAMVVLSS